ncbi:FMN-binding domain-containing protein [Arenibacter nanhaiticus]|uniref:FMN-binding domain-containing protein n=1 Tax=Arenibacter nanhaiticus TaxID=558155 RepID=A0A1M6BFU5_9FLAO|nr:FMN-binding protein [Arenibacter nanhaiticus]SHI47630.1 FMN-binding domain-containing protein [Arenibacter nanhaiticus]
MLKKIRITGFLMATAFMVLGFGLPKNLQNRVNKEVEKVFNTSVFTLKSVSVPNGVNASLPTKITSENFFAVKTDTGVLGYVFVENAPSKTATFDFLLVFDKDLSIVHSKVLIYREEYGGEIGSKRWLRQFNGKNGKDRVSHETNIDGISGATISVRSMTDAIDDILQTVGILQVKNIL